MIPMRHLSLLLCFVSTSVSAEWNNWRGPNYNLSTGDEAFPLKFSPNENVVWSARIPGEGTPTPAIRGDNLYLTCMDTLIAFNLKGKRLWEAQIGIGEEGIHRAGTGANPSPVVDDSGVYVYFKFASLDKFIHSGKELWEKTCRRDTASPANGGT